MLQEEKELVQRFRMPFSRKAAFEEMVKRYSRPLFAHISRWVDIREDIEDLLQVVWVKAWKGLDNFRGESRLSTWLFTIATREAYNYHRSKKPLRMVDASSEEVFSNSSSSNPDAANIMKMLQEAIDTLPPKQQQVFMMRYFEDMTYEMMAESTGTSVGALKASYHHAVKKIEQLINPN
jgi:RNA polymerase sigma-70 factor (ECF subfamily)